MFVRGHWLICENGRHNEVSSDQWISDAETSRHIRVLYKKHRWHQVEAIANYEPKQDLSINLKTVGL